MCQALCQALHTYYITRETGELQSNIVLEIKEGKVSTSRVDKQDQGQKEVK